MRELASVHREALNDICFTNNFKYLISVGQDQILKVWDYDFSLQGPGCSQIFMGHINKINNCLFLPDNKRILTVAGFEGIYEWEFFGDLTP